MQVSKPVAICRRDKPSADLARTENSGPQKRKFGTLGGRIKINDPNWWHPMSQDDVDAMLLTSDSQGPETVTEPRA